MGDGKFVLSKKMIDTFKLKPPKKPITSGMILVRGEDGKDYELAVVLQITMAFIERHLEKDGVI